LLLLVGFNVGALNHMVLFTCSSDIGTKIKKTSSVTGMIDSFGTFGACIS